MDSDYQDLSDSQHQEEVNKIRESNNLSKPDFGKMHTLNMVKREESVYPDVVLKNLKIEPVGSFKLEEYLDDVDCSRWRNFRLGKVGYCFKCTMNDTTWKIYKKQKSLKHLHQDLEKELYENGRENGIYKSVYCRDMGKSDQESMQKALEYHCEYLNELVEDADLQDSQRLKEFFELSNVSFTIKGCNKYIEGKLKKRSGGRFRQEKKSFLFYCGKCYRVWKDKWFILTDQYLAYLNSSEDDQAYEIMLIDNNFEIKYGSQTKKDNEIYVINKHRNLRIRAKDPFEYKRWLRAFKKVMKNSIWGPNSKIRNESFAPERSFNDSKYFIDGESYFQAVYTALCNAKKTVYITDWMFTPQLYLKRPVNLDDDRDLKYRIDKILGELAERKVKIFIIIYKEVEFVGLYHASSWVKNWMQALHKNIKVLRHPRSFVSLWSHHEKICIVDQQYAFLGGIDLCLGRYDTKQHSIRDLGENNGKFYFPGKDYTSSYISDFKNVKDFTHSQLDRKIQPRMPWHDLQVFIRGDSVYDLSRHFIEYWNHAKLDKTGTGSKESGQYLKPVKPIKARGKKAKEHKDEDKHKDSLSFIYDSDSNEGEGEGDDENSGDNTDTNQFNGYDPAYECSDLDLDRDESSIESSLESYDSDHGNYKGQAEDEESIDQVEKRKDSSGSGGNTTHYESKKNIPEQKTNKGQKSQFNISALAAVVNAPSSSEKEEKLKLLRDCTRLDHDEEEDKNVDQFATAGDNKILEEMKNFTNKNYNHDKKKLRIKNLFKKAIGKDVNDDKQRQKYQDQFIYDHLDEEQKKMFWKEKEENKDMDDLNILEKDNPKLTLTLDRTQSVVGSCKCQILRSSCNWSTGINKPERSIYNAYINMINNAEHFIYIENQFFISNCGDEGVVKNKIAMALKDRIVRAHKEKQKFIVYIIIPLMPGFEGDICKSESSLLKLQLMYEQRTIKKGPNSLFSHLESEGVDPSMYLKFYGLRKHDVYKNVEVEDPHGSGNKTTRDVAMSAIIYVHSKLMIVDDRRLIIGSANINDRSMLGTRDSEMAVVIEDTKIIKSKIAGKTYKVGEMPHNFRMDLFREHFGIEDDDELLKDPFNQELFEISKRNSEIFREVFNAEPDNHQTTFERIEQDRQKQNKRSYDEILENYYDIKDEIRGHIVDYPVDFLIDADIEGKISNVAKLFPDINFT